MIMTGKEIVKKLKAAGWKHTSTRGSHYRMEKKGYRSVPVPVHSNRDLGIGLIKAIEKQTSVSLLKER